MKKILLLILTITFLISCKKETSSTNSSSNNSSLTNDIVGKYSGIINVSKTGSLDAGGNYSSSSTEMKNVEITKTNSTYYLNGNALSGGPQTYSLSKTSYGITENYIINTTNIQFSSSQSVFGNYGGGKGNYNINKSGTLQKN